MSSGLGGLERNRENFPSSVYANDVNLADLDDVHLNNPQSGDALYFGPQSVWLNNPISSLLLTSINGVTGAAQLLVAAPGTGVGLTIVSSGTKHTFSVSFNAALDDLSDVTMIGSTTGNWLNYTGTSWTNQLKSLQNFNDFTISGTTNNDILRYSGTSWLNSTTKGSVGATDSKITVTGGANKTVTSLDVSVGFGDVHLHEFSDVIDASVGGAGRNSVFYNSGTKWIAANPGPLVASDSKLVITAGPSFSIKGTTVTVALGAVTLDDLSAVSILNLVSNQALILQGNTWVNVTQNSRTTLLATAQVAVPVASVGFTNFVDNTQYKSYRLTWEGVSTDINVAAVMNYYACSRNVASNTTALALWSAVDQDGTGTTFSTGFGRFTSVTNGHIDNGVLDWTIPTSVAGVTGYTVFVGDYFRDQAGTRVKYLTVHQAKRVEECNAILFITNSSVQIAAGRFNLYGIK